MKKQELKEIINHTVMMLLEISRWAFGFTFLFVLIIFNFDFSNIECLGDL
jgi:hypothetical protein